MAVALREAILEGAAQCVGDKLHGCPRTTGSAVKILSYDGLKDRSDRTKYSLITTCKQRDSTSLCSRY